LDIQSAAALAGLLARLSPGRQIKLHLKRKEGGKEDVVTVVLTTVPDTVPDTLPLPSSGGKPPGKAPTIPDPLAPKKGPKLPKKPAAAPGVPGVAFVSAQEPKKGAKEKEPPAAKAETGLLRRT